MEYQERPCIQCKICCEKYGAVQSCKEFLRVSVPAVLSILRRNSENEQGTIGSVQTNALAHTQSCIDPCSLAHTHTHTHDQESIFLFVLSLVK